MDRKLKKIEMFGIKEIIATKGFYYLPLCRFYDTFSGCRYIIVTDNPQFAAQNPAFAKKFIMMPEEFEPYAEIFNAYLANEDREWKWRQFHTDDNESDEGKTRLRQFAYFCRPSVMCALNM